MFNESLRGRLQELSGILQEGSKETLEKFGINDQVASYISKIDEKLAIFVANITLFEFAKEKGIEEGNLRELIPIINQNEYLRFLDNNKDRISYVIDWIKTAGGQVNIKEIEDLSQAERMAHEWHETQEASGVIEDESGKVIKTYPKEGLYWIDLQTNSSREEAEAMGHCGRDSRATTLFSLRDKDKSPHVTISYNENEKTITQVKGRNNKRPLPEYMNFVFDFLRQLISEGKVLSFGWSYDGDLTQDEIAYLFEGNKETLAKGYMEKNINSQIYNPLPFTKEELIDMVGQEEYKEYVKKLLKRSLEIPTFNPDLKKGDIVETIGYDNFVQYVRDFVEIAKRDSRYKVVFSRKDLIKILGEDEYNQYVDNLLKGVLIKPTEGLPLEKDDVAAILGQERYKEFMRNVLINLLKDSSVRNVNRLKYILEDKYRIPFDEKKIEDAVGKMRWFQFKKKEVMSQGSNVRGSLWD